MPADPSGFDHFRRGEPTQFQRGKTDNTGLDYYRRAEPYGAEIPVAVADGFLPKGMAPVLQAVNRSNIY